MTKEQKVATWSLMVLARRSMAPKVMQPLRPTAMALASSAPTILRMVQSPDFA